MNDLKTMDLLPSDEETAQWFEDNIGIVNDCSASSAIYKFRLWLKDRQQYADQQANQDSIAFMEWKEDEGYECVMYDDVKMWQKKGTKPYSSEQLYNLYIQSKQQ